MWNKKEKKVCGARDHFGIKPFYYYKKGEDFFFGSEIKSFLAHPNFVKEVNKKALKMFLIFQYSVHEETWTRSGFVFVFAQKTDPKIGPLIGRFPEFEPSDRAEI